MSIPLVSVLIDTYNHERFIEQAIASVLEQDVPPSEMEIIVVDDGSTDGTPRIVQKFVPRVRHLRKANGGQASAFNAGIPETQGQIVAFLDGDDWWAKGKLRAVLDVLGKNPEVGAVGHGFYEVDSGSNTLAKVVPDRDYRFDLRDIETARLGTQLGCFLGTSRFTARASLLHQILPVPVELVVEADEYLFTLAPAIAPVMVLSQPLFHYRLHENNLYMIQSNDSVRLRSKQRALETLLRALPEALARFGISEAVIKIALAYLKADVERMKLSLDGGKPWQTFAAERAAYALDNSRASFGHRLFKSLMLGLTLVMPPRRFYGLRRWYSARGLRRLRKVLGEPKPSGPAIQTMIANGKRS